LQSRGASFFRDLYYATGSGDEDTVLDALWDLVWAGEVTNDTFLPLRMLGPRARRNPRRPMMRRGPPAAAGRWSLGSDLLHPAVSPTEHLHADAVGRWRGRVSGGLTWWGRAVGAAGAWRAAHGRCAPSVRHALRICRRWRQWRSALASWRSGAATAPRSRTQLWTGCCGRPASAPRRRG